MKKLIIFLAIMFIAAPAFCATLSWDASSGAEGYLVKYRMVGAPVWIDAAAPTVTSFDLDTLPLTADTRYEFQVFSTASGSTSDGSDIIRWTFEGQPEIINILERVKSVILNFGD